MLKKLLLPVNRYPSSSLISLYRFILDIKNAPFMQEGWLVLGFCVFPGPCG
jgi:hypothetical protein